MRTLSQILPPTPRLPTESLIIPASTLSPFYCRYCIALLFIERVIQSFLSTCDCWRRALLRCRCNVKHQLLFSIVMGGYLDSWTIQHKSAMKYVLCSNVTFGWSSKSTHWRWEAIDCLFFSNSMDGMGFSRTGLCGQPCVTMMPSLKLLIPNQLSYSRLWPWEFWSDVEVEVYLQTTIRGGSYTNAKI